MIKLGEPGLVSILSIMSYPVWDNFTARRAILRAKTGKTCNYRQAPRQIMRCDYHDEQYYCPAREKLQYYGQNWTGRTAKRRSINLGQAAE